MRRGMTLIELLIVIFIIAVIVGLTFSAISQARKRAYLASCISNLRQLIQAVHMYEDAWGAVPIEDPTKTPEGMYGFVQQMLYPYVRSDALFLCPADFTYGEAWYAEDALGRPKPNPKRVILWKGKRWVTSYGYLVNTSTVQVFGKGNPRLKSRSPLFMCDWHIPHFKVDVIGRYDGTVEIGPPGRYKEGITAEFEAGP